MFDKLKTVMKTLGLRGEDPITTRKDLVRFIDSRAAYVSQVTLYTYVKARAGTQYPKLFANTDFLTSLKIARSASATASSTRILTRCARAESSALQWLIGVRLRPDRPLSSPALTLCFAGRQLQMN